MKADLRNAECRGAVSGCCVGSLTILTSDDDGVPKVVFHASNHLLAAVMPSDDGSTLQIIGQLSDSEARALQNAQSSDPYRVYLLQGDHAAKYDLALSKAYTLSNYCHWHGSKYDERFVAVGPPIGADKCRVMTITSSASTGRSTRSFFRNRKSRKVGFSQVMD